MLKISSVQPRNWSISAQLVAFSLFIAIGAVASLGILSTRDVSSSVSALQTQSLKALSEERANLLVQKINSIKEHVQVLASDKTIAVATAEFSEAFTALPSDLAAIGVANATDTAPMDSYLDSAFSNGLKANNNTFRGASAYRPDSQAARAAQRLYIAENPNPVGSKHNFDRAPQDIPYNTLHAEIHPRLSAYVDQLGYYDLFLLNLDGDIIYSVFKETDYATNFVKGPFAESGLGELFREARQSPEGAETLIEFAPYEPSYGSMAWFIGAPLFHDGQRVGVVALQIRIDYIDEVLGAPFGETGQTVMLGSDGTLFSKSICTPDAKVFSTKIEHEAAIAAMSGEEGSMFCQDSRGEPILATYSRLPVDGQDWYLIASMDEDEVLAASQQMARGIATKSLIIAVTVTILGLFFASSLSKPIKAIVAAVQEIASGKLSTRVTLNRRDELGTLSTAINSMTENLSEVISEVQGSATEVAGAATQIAAGAEEMAAGMDQQRRQTAQVSAAVEEMSASVSEVAEKSSGCAKKSDEGGEQAIEGGKVVQETIAGMNSISEQVNDSVTAVGELGRRSEQIGEIIEVINDIADQTNLLALNAAIEAARAGEHGRGFAVVADEVRKLAERTTKATEEVAESIKAIQTETGSAVQRMEAGKTRVDEGVHLAQRAGKALEEIVSGAREIAPMIQGIAAAAEEQSAAANEISSNVERINAVTNESADGVHQVAQAASTLSQKAETLQGLVRRFEI